MCRKFTSSLLPQFLYIHPPQLNEGSWLSSFPSYTEYTSSTEPTKKFRGFCKTCGSSLIWREEGTEKFDLYLGTLDEEFLVGNVVSGSEVRTERGVECQRIGGVGRELARVTGKHFSCSNRIEGLEDVIKGGEECWE